ncbi:MAG: ASCH domain-containing protein [Kiritimatiellae bacterium]|nr:ASCH domain-containing protein [Kiritimatiellia bacterium]
MSANATFLRSKCEILPLVLKGEWFDMIASGEKREEYRTANRYWAKRLWNWNQASLRNETMPVVEFRHGYASDAPRMAFWTVGLPCSCGMMPFAYVEDQCLYPEWGEPTTPHFFIRFGGAITLIDR